MSHSHSHTGDYLDYKKSFDLISNNLKIGNNYISYTNNLIVVRNTNSDAYNETVGDDDAGNIVLSESKHKGLTVKIFLPF